MKIENLLAKEKSLGVSTPRSAPDSCEYQHQCSLSSSLLTSWQDFVQQAEIDERQTAWENFALAGEGNNLHFQFSFFDFPHNPIGNIKN